MTVLKKQTRVKSPESFTLVQGGSLPPNPLEPLLSIGNQACRTVLLVFRVVCFFRNLSNDFLTGGIITPWTWTTPAH